MAPLIVPRRLGHEWGTVRERRHAAATAAGVVSSPAPKLSDLRSLHADHLQSERERELVHVVRLPIQREALPRAFGDDDEPNLAPESCGGEQLEVVPEGLIE